MIKDRIRNLCKEKGINIPKLEAELGLSSGTISKWDKSSPKIDNVKKIADYFGCTIDYLVSDNDNEEFKEQPKEEASAKRQRAQKAYDLLMKLDEEAQKDALDHLKIIVRQSQRRSEE